MIERITFFKYSKSFKYLLQLVSRIEGRIFDHPNGRTYVLQLDECKPVAGGYKLVVQGHSAEKAIDLEMINSKGDVVTSMFYEVYETISKTDAKLLGNPV